MDDQELKQLTRDCVDYIINTFGASLRIDKPRYSIGFSGIPGSGKSYFSDRLVKDLGAIKLEKDSIRAYLKSRGASIEERRSVQEDVMSEVIEVAAASPNGLLVFDSSLDRVFTEANEQNASMGYKLIRISIEVSEDIALNRVSKRFGAHAPLEEYIRCMPGWVRDHNNFLGLHAGELDLIVDNNGDAEEAYALIRSTVEQAMSE